MKMKHERPSILCILQLPPPLHGASLMNQQLINSERIQEAYEMKVVNIVTAHTIGAIGSFSLKKLVASGRLWLKIRKALKSFQPDLVYFTLSPSGFAFYRDAAFLFLIRSFSS